ncbi:MAG: thioredoxin family protein, partial [Verrucomicrobia bacterium]|nr:thioredoxin family protein [Verrucomicrobiota bacterium]
WKVGFMNACKQAAAEKKMVFVDFTGSDWCGWCQKLEREVFLTPQFKAYAEKKLVLVRADFPHRHPQSAEVKAQNAKLQAAFGISGYPTIVVLNSAGQPVGRLGYLEGGPVPFLAALQKLESR